MNRYANIIKKKKRRDTKRWSTTWRNHEITAGDIETLHKTVGEMNDCFPNNHKYTQGQQIKTVVRSDAARHENTHSHMLYEDTVTGKKNN